MNKYRDLVIALLRGASAPMPLSDVWRGLQYRGVDVSFSQVEDWLLDLSELVQLSVDGRVALRDRQEFKNIRPTRIVPDRYEDSTDINASTRWHRLLAYYKDCLLEEGKSISAYREQENSSFVILPEELHSKSKPLTFIKTAEKPDFIRNVADEARTTYYGYPLLLEWIETGDGEFADYKAIPVFIARMEVDRDPACCRFFLDTNAVRLNPFISSRVKWRERAFVRSRLDADSEAYSSFAERLEMIAAVLPDVKIWEDIDPLAIVCAKSLADIEPKKAGLFNRCGVFLSGTNPYIQGLIRDLDEMSTKSQGHFEQTALAPLLRTKTENAGRTFELDKRIRVLSPGDKDSLLNGPQEFAVAQAFTNQISAITGPPGTGKSQVVTSIITSAVLQGRSILFASRNNKALEVVQERIKKTCALPQTLVRVGGDYDQDCNNLLQRMGGLPAHVNAMPFSQQLQTIDLHLEELDKLNAKLDRVAEQLGAASIAEDRFMVLKKKFLQESANAREAVKSFNSNVLLVFAKRLEMLCDLTAGKPRFISKLIIRLQSSKGRTELSILNSALSTAGISCVLTWPITRDQLLSDFAQIFPLIDLVQSAADMAKTAEELGAADGLNRIFMDIHEHKAAVAVKVAPLLAAKVRENSSGVGQPETTDEAIQRYHTTMPTLRGNKLNDDQRRVRLDELGRVFPDLLHRLPAWAVTNLSVSHRIPLEPGLFDLVVIDEASQCDIPSCLPLLYRAKQAVIIGDPLQLQQITKITRNAEDRFLRKQELDGPEFDHLRYSDKSMYDAAQWVAPRSASQFLSSHYRCHPDIIRYANSSHWYEDRLDVFTDVDTLKRPAFWKRGIEWIQVKSQTPYKGKTYLLQDEVAKTVQVVSELIQEHRYEGTVGVVCPLRDMTDRIRDGVEKVVDAVRLQHAKFEAQTAHGFQGDERDIIVFSMAIHPNMPRGPRWFIADNKNLFNVALSRARACFLVVGDKEAVSQFKFEDKPVEYLQQFIDYVEHLGEQEQFVDGAPVFAPEQLWEERFYLQALKPGGIPVYSQYPLGPYKLDFALLRKDRQRKLDIEIDGESYHKDSAGKRLRRDIDRDIYVKAQDGRKWDIMRFWVYELREDMTSCLEKIQQWINSAP